MKKIFIIQKNHRGRENYIQGTVEQLAKYFGYLLENGRSWEDAELREKNSRRAATIKTDPKTIGSLMKSLDKAVYYTQGSCYEQDSYYLVDAVPENATLDNLNS